MGIRKAAAVAVVGSLTSNCGPRPQSAEVPQGAPLAASSASTPAAGAARARPEQKGGAKAVSVTVSNPLAVSRKGEVVVVPLVSLREAYPWFDLGKAVVLGKDGKAVVSQLVDRDGDETLDEILFQTDLGANESQSFEIQLGQRQYPNREDFRVYGRFVRERHDDFVWENDRVAHRMYGPDLETYKKEMLVSSGIDTWVKRVPRLLVNDWYMTGNYHDDAGEGADFYSVGKTRGCGGSGIWNKGKLFVSRNFTRSRVLSAGPIRLVFELEYAPWDAGGARVSETKRVTLDAGSNFNHFESTYTGLRPPASVAIGIAKHAGSTSGFDKQGWAFAWEPLNGGKSGNLGCAIVSAPGAAESAEDEANRLLVVPAPANGLLSFYVGSAWDRGGQVSDAAGFKKEIELFANRIAAPISLKVARTAGARSWSEGTAETVLSRKPALLTSAWRGDSAFVLRGFAALANSNKEEKYYAALKQEADAIVGANGAIQGYAADEHALDAFSLGKVLFALLRETTPPADRERYTSAIKTIRTQLNTHSRTKEGGIAHSKGTPGELWADDAFLVLPFLAEYAKAFDEPALFDEVGKQAALIDRRLRDPKTGLLYQGWDETKSAKWASPKTGTSQAHFARSNALFAAALADVLEVLPETHRQRATLRGIFDRHAAAVVRVQDENSGAFWQVLDAGKRDKNYLEASASSLFAYALAKGARSGWLDQKKAAPAARRAYGAVLAQFVTVDDRGNIDVNKISKGGGLGATAADDGSLAAYSSSEAVTNDPKGVATFLLASLELEKTP